MIPDAMATFLPATLFIILASFWYVFFGFYVFYYLEFVGCDGLVWVPLFQATEHTQQITAEKHTPHPPQLTAATKPPS